MNKILRMMFGMMVVMFVSFFCWNKTGLCRGSIQ